MPLHFHFPILPPASLAHSLEETAQYGLRMYHRPLFPQNILALSNHFVKVALSRKSWPPPAGLDMAAYISRITLI